MAIDGNQRQSVAIDSSHLVAEVERLGRLVADASEIVEIELDAVEVEPDDARVRFESSAQIRCNQTQPEAIRGNQGQSEASCSSRELCGRDASAPLR